MKTKTNELHGLALNWAVTQCEGAPGQYSTDWALGGPIIERERIGFGWVPLIVNEYGEHGNLWYAEGVGVDDGYVYTTASTALVAAMRCYVESKLGDEVDVPDDLTL